MINTIWNIKTICLQNADEKLDCLFYLTNKEARYIYALYFMIGVNKIADLSIDIGFNHRL